MGWIKMLIGWACNHVEAVVTSDTEQNGDYLVYEVACDEQVVLTEADREKDV